MNNKRPRLVDGFHRASEDDNSSSGCSSSGPGGLRNLMPSPIPPLGRSMSGTYFGQSSPIDESQQHQLQRQLPRNGMLSSSRYLPYSIRPLVVRAKRKLQNDSDVHVTSTARRIINALDNIATPVVNSVKIPFKPIISSHPVYTPLRRDTQGPPIMKSPLIPSPQGKIVYNPAMHLHIPRMMDFGTNTDLSMSSFNNNVEFLHIQQQPPLGMSTSSLDDYSSKGSSGGKMKSSFSSRMHAAPIKSSSSANMPASRTVTFATPDNFVFMNSNVESRYSFSEPWSVEDMNKLISKQKKSDMDMKPIATGKSGSNLTPVTKKWECNKCKLSHDSSVVKCPCETKTKKEEEPLKPWSSFVVPSGAGTDKWRCKECYIDNKSVDANCVACGEKNPSPPLPKAPAKKNWSCGGCWCSNAPDLPTCPSCGEKNPSAPLPKAPAKKNWSCGGCWCSNAPDLATCPSCGEKNPDAASPAAATTTPVPASTFSFGFGAQATTTAATDEKTPKSGASTTSSTFSFGPPKDSSTPKSTFTFGVKSETPTSSTKGSPAPTSSFTFGTGKAAESPKPIITSTPEQPKPFGGFNLPGTGSAPKTSASVSFGVPVEPSAATAVKSSPSSGMLAKTPEAVLSPKAAVPITTIAKSPPSSNPFASFSFGGAQPTSTSGINSLPGVVKENAEYWNCQNCPARTRVSSNQCIGCAGPKPSVAANKAKPAGGKRFHFEPFFGGRPEEKANSEVNDYSEPEPELKRKIPSSSSHNSSSSSSLGFMYTPPTESTLKYKTPESHMPVTSTQPSEMKQGSFLDALGSGSQFKFQAPSPGASIIPSGPSSAVSSSTSASTTLNNLIKTDSSSISTSTSSLAAPVVSSSSSSVSSGGGVLSSLSSTTGAGGPPSGLFQFGATSPSAVNSMASPMNMNNNSLTQSTFTFGGGGGGGLKNGPLSSSSSPAPSIFGSSMSSSSSLLTGGASATIPSVFGSPVPVAPSPMVPAQQSTISSPTPSAPPSAQFNLTPNFNFGGPLTAPGPGSFVFTAQPTGGPQGDGGVGQRKIRRATRRIR